MAIIRPPRRTPPIFARPTINPGIGAAVGDMSIVDIAAATGRGPKDKKSKKDKSNSKAAAAASRRRRLVLDGNAAPAYWDNVVFQTDWDGVDGATEAVDQSPSGHTMTFGQNAQIDTGVVGPYGSGSTLLLDGVDDVVNIADSDDWTFQDNFTVELWIRPTVIGSARVLVGQYEVGGGKYGWMYRLDVEKTRFELSDDGSAAGYFHGTTNGLTVDNWHHVAYCRDGGTSYNFINGVDSANSIPVDISAIHAANGNAKMRIGGAWSDTAPIWEYTGNIGPIRIVNGTSLYTEDFDVPTEPWYSG